jgi:hypothetical protein
MSLGLAGVEERAADLHARMAALYSRAAFRWSKPMPGRLTGLEVDVSERYRCDYY